MKRIGYAIAGLWFIGAAQAAPPLRNLSVEMRISDAQVDAQRGAQGSVTIGSRDGRIDADGAVTVQAGSTRQMGDAAQSAERLTQPSGQALPPQAELFTTVQAPLGEWVAVARLNSRSERSSLSTGGFGAATASRERSLQLRVSLP